MANNPKLTNLAASEEVDAIAALVNSGKFRIYDGSQPAAADDEVTTQTLLAELTFGNPAFGAAANGVADANSITGDSSADNTGVASWFRWLKSDSSTKVLDGSVGTTGCDLNLGSVNIQQGAQVDVTAFSITCPKS